MLEGIPLNFGIQYSNKTSFVNLKLTSIKNPIALINNKEIVMPSFVKLNNTSEIFSVEGATYKEVGTYKIGWRLGYAEFPEAQV